jgi:hypothetical protein
MAKPTNEKTPSGDAQRPRFPYQQYNITPTAGELAATAVVLALLVVTAMALVSAWKSVPERASMTPRVDEVEEMMEHPDARVRRYGFWEAKTEVGKPYIGEEVIQRQFVAGLDDPDPAVRRMAIEPLMELNHDRTLGYDWRAPFSNASRVAIQEWQRWLESRHRRPSQQQTEQQETPQPPANTEEAQRERLYKTLLERGEMPAWGPRIDRLPKEQRRQYAPR